MTLATSENLSDILGRLTSARDDEQAWLMLFKALWPILLATSFYILRGNRFLAEDVCQEVLLRILRYAHFEDFVGNPEGFVSYVRAICRNVSRDYLDGLLKEGPESSESAASRDGLADRASEPLEDIVIHKELASGFYAALDQEDRDLLDLLQSEQSINQISEILGISYTNTAVRIHRLRHKVSKFMKEQEI